MARYCTQSDVEALMSITIDSGFSATLDVWIEAMSRVIDKITNRSVGFVASGSATERSYFGDSTNILLIDDCVSIDSITAGETDPTTLVEGTDYRVLPLNGTPKTRVQKIGGRWSKHTIYNVDADWGYASAVPDAIKIA